MAKTTKRIEERWTDSRGRTYTVVGCESHTDYDQFSGLGTTYYRPVSRKQDVTSWVVLGGNGKAISLLAQDPKDDTWEVRKIKREESQPQRFWVGNGSWYFGYSTALEALEAV